MSEKHTSIVDGELYSHIPIRPKCATPHILFLFASWSSVQTLPLIFGVGFAIRVQAGASINIRFHEHLVHGLSPYQLHAIPGTNDEAQRHSIPIVIRTSRIELV